MTLAEAERAMLAEAVEAARRLQRRLRRTLGTLDARLPFDADRLAALDEDGQMAADALLMQFINLVAIVQDRLMRSILFAAGEDVEGQTRIDRRSTAEKLDAWPPGLDFGIVARARNTLAHQYPHDPAKQVVIVNGVLGAIPLAMKAADAMLSYVARRHPDL